MDKITNKEPLLFLSHRIPFPPNKGDKIRSFNILKKLSEQYHIYLGCFIDDPFDKQYLDGLKKYCQVIYHLDQHKALAKAKGLKAFFINKPITLPYYHSKLMQQWVNRTIVQNNIQKVFVYSSSMAQYCENREGENRTSEIKTSTIDFNSLERVIDFVDVDSDKWRQYAEKKTGLAKWIFHREYKQLATYEDHICQQFNHSLFVSPDEAALFRNRQPSSQQNKVHGMLNGVDTKFFDPQGVFSEEKLVPQSPFIAFTGAMDYWANIDAVLWFTENVWPKVLLKHREALFVIVGGNPSSEIQALAKQKGIIVTGRVHDIRPYITNAACMVAPLRIARGIQNKVLEAMALNKPVVVTSMAMEGINAPASEDIHIIDQADEFAEHCGQFLIKGTDNQPKNRDWIIQQFTWQQTLQPLLHYFTDKDEV